MVTGKTEKGFEFEVNENISKDFRLVIATAKINSEETLEKVAGTYDFVAAILGKAGTDRLVEFAIKECGFADTDFILAQAKEILSYATTKDPETKKS